jgi:hypothetical protein
MDVKNNFIEYQRVMIQPKRKLLNNLEIWILLRIFII